MSCTDKFHPFRAAVALVLMVQLAFAQAMASSPALHEDCHHHHHDEGGHTCVVELMTGGGYGTVLPDIVPVDVLPERTTVVPVIPVPVRIAPCHLAGGVLAHAPPRGP